MKSSVVKKEMQPEVKIKPKFNVRRRILNNWDIYLLLVPVLAYFIIFKYVPMYGVQIAFKDFIATKGITGSDWVGFKHFTRFFDSYYFWRLIKNTLGIGLYELVVAFPIPIILALMINEVRLQRFKKLVQNVTYAPHFLSTVVIVGMLVLFLNPNYGIINTLLSAIGIGPIDFMTEPAWFKTIYVFSHVWQQMGWSSIIYLAALAGVPPELHEAAKMDGASRLQRIWHVNIPAIVPVMIILLILNVGNIIDVGFEKVFLMQNPLNKVASDVIATHVYETGIMGAQYSYSTAVGLFNSVISFILLVIVNQISRKVSETSLW